MRLEDEGIEYLDLTVRAYNVLKREGVNTIQQMISAYDDGSLRGFRNLGGRAYYEIIGNIAALRGEMESLDLLHVGQLVFSRDDDVVVIQDTAQDVSIMFPAALSYRVGRALTILSNEGGQG